MTVITIAGYLLLGLDPNKSPVTSGGFLMSCLCCPGLNLEFNKNRTKYIIQYLLFS